MTVALTVAQTAMLARCRTTVVRTAFGRDGQTVWMLGTARATSGEARVLGALQERRAIRMESQTVQLEGWAGPRPVRRAVPVEDLTLT